VNSDETNSNIELGTDANTFTLRPKGKTVINLPNGQEGLVFLFTIHDTTPNGNMLVHQFDDGTSVMILMQSAPVILPQKNGKQLFVPEKNLKLVH